MQSSTPINILLVDDQAGSLMRYEAILSGLGENLVKASTADEALDHLLRTEFAVVLIDACMPKLSGLELSKLLREHPRFDKTAIILVSAIAIDDPDRLRSYEAGAIDYMAVPVVPEFLRAKVKLFVELFRKMQKLETLNRVLECRVAERTVDLQESTARLLESERRLRLASEAAEFGTYDYDVATGRMRVCPHLGELLDTGAELNLELDNFLALVHEDDREMVRERLLAAGGEEGQHESEFRVVRPDGQICWLLDRGRRYEQAEGSAAGSFRIVGTVLDITSRKTGEQTQSLLMAELDHRVKNILASISAMIRLSSRRTTSVEAFVSALEGRVQAIAQAHGLLRQGKWCSTDLGELLTAILQPFQSAGGDLRLEGPPLAVGPIVAQPLALMFHELATNAAKHGALSVPQGKVRVRWARAPTSGDCSWELVWTESGGPAIAADRGAGFGMMALKAAAASTGCMLDCSFPETGMVCRLLGPFALGSGSSSPLRTATMETPASIKVDAVPGPGRRVRRILVVEDEPLVALQLQEDLESDGHHVIGPARNVSQGIAFAQREQIDLALIDLRLGDETSTRLAEYLMERGVPFAFATGFSDSAALPAPMRSIPRISKPYTIETVRRVVEMLIR